MITNLLEILKSGKDKIIYKKNNNQITYYECYNKVLELSNTLKKQGNSNIIVYGSKSIDNFITILSCVVAQRCYIPIDTNTPINRINEIIKKSNATLLIKNEDISINGIESLTIKELISKYNNLNIYNNSNDNAYIIFTSGTTGESKGVPISYSNLSNFIGWIIKTKELTNFKNKNILSVSNFSFDLSVMDIYFSIYNHNTIISLDNKDKEDLNYVYNTILKDSINMIVMTPTFIKLLLLDNNFNEINYSNIECMFFCGETLEVETVKKIKERFKNIKIINAYGPTEATCCISLIEVTDKMLEYDYLPVGNINTSAVKIEIVNNEIVLKGKSVFNGYININSNNCYKENNNNCYKTGDYGYIENNYLYFKGRKDNQIKYKGYRIELGDIENNLLKISEVKEAVVTIKYKDNTNIVKLLKAFIVTSTKVTSDYIKKKLSKLVPNYMIPKTIVFLEKIPTNNNGKYDRKKLSNL